MLKIDCGEFQMEHEVAKLIGAPPGYLGHRETQPMLTQQKLSMAASEKSSLSLVLFDEVEKAAPSLTRLLLGILDKAVLRLGDNTTVNFERSLIFLTSNLGSRSMMNEILPDSASKREPAGSGRDVGRKLDQHRRRRGAQASSRRNSSTASTGSSPTIPLDRTVARRDSGPAHRRVPAPPRRAPRAPTGSKSRFLPKRACAILRKGTSVEFGARELKRTLHRHLTEPLAALVAGGGIAPGSSVRLRLR